MPKRSPHAESEVEDALPADGQALPPTAPPTADAPPAPVAPAAAIAAPVVAAAAVAKVPPAGIAWGAAPAAPAPAQPAKVPPTGVVWDSAPVATAPTGEALAQPPRQPPEGVVWGPEPSRPGASPKRGSTAPREEVRLQGASEQRAAPAGIVYGTKPDAAATVRAPSPPVSPPLSPAVREPHAPEGIARGPPAAAEVSAPPRGRVGDAGGGNGPGGVQQDPTSVPRAAGGGRGRDRPGVDAGEKGGDGGGQAGGRQPPAQSSEQPSGQHRPRPRLQAPPPRGWAQQQYHRLGLVPGGGGSARPSSAPCLPHAAESKPPPRAAAALPVAAHPLPPTHEPPAQAQLPREVSTTSSASRDSGAEEPKKKGLIGRLKQIVPLRRTNSKDSSRSADTAPYAPDPSDPGVVQLRALSPSSGAHGLLEQLQPSCCIKTRITIRCACRSTPPVKAPPPRAGPGMQSTPVAAHPVAVPHDAGSVPAHAAPPPQTRHPPAAAPPPARPQPAAATRWPDNNPSWARDVAWPDMTLRTSPTRNGSWLQGCYSYNLACTRRHTC